MSNNRLGSPASDPAGCAIESTRDGAGRRFALRAWHPLVNIPSTYFSIEEFAHKFGLIVPERKKPERKRATAG